MRLLVLGCLALGCAAHPAAPFDTLKNSGATMLRLQNYEPPAQQAGAPAAAPSRAVGKGAGPLSPLAEMPAAFQTALPKLRLQVLVYDRSEADAWVFINNRKYVVGDRLGDDITHHVVGPTDEEEQR